MSRLGLAYPLRVHQLTSDFDAVKSKVGLQYFDNMGAKFEQYLDNLWPIFIEYLYNKLTCKDNMFVCVLLRMYIDKRQATTLVVTISITIFFFSIYFSHRGVLRIKKLL